MAATASTSTPSDAAYRGILTACAMAATLMQTLDTTITNVALPYMQGSLSRHVRPDHLGADLLYRGRRDHDGADRLAVLPLRPQGACSSSPWPASPSPRCSAGSRNSMTRDRAVQAPARRIRRRAGAALAGHHSRHLSARAARFGAWLWGHGRGDRADPRPDARRLSDGLLQLALGLLHQPAAGDRDGCGPVAVPQGHRPEKAVRVRLPRICRAESRAWRPAAHARPRRAAGLVRLDRDHRLRRPVRARLLPVRGPHVHRGKSP